ncbi:MAG: hypothetical protein KDH15_02010 [Rhodocyclaceae bacterium]|nr:hypothetical protein [Rhodocyclaceae bacterium]
MNITLHDWHIVRVEARSGPQLRLVGRGSDGKYRVSSMLLSFDRGAREAETASGKSYTLDGRPCDIKHASKIVDAYRQRHGMIEIAFVDEREIGDLFQMQATLLSDYPPLDCLYTRA